MMGMKFLNLSLSEQRANIVRDFLIGEGIEDGNKFKEHLARMNQFLIIALEEEERLIDVF